VGGLLLSPLLTLDTTPVVYLYLDRFRVWHEEPVEPPESCPRSNRFSALRMMRAEQFPTSRFNSR